MHAVVTNEDAQAAAHLLGHKLQTENSIPVHVAAYLLDHDGWAKVPTSVLVRARHPIFCYNNRMSSVRASSIDLAAKDTDRCRHMTGKMCGPLWYVVAADAGAAQCAGLLCKNADKCRRMNAEVCRRA
eukprot:225876-Pelagomonas_calceolata.AAC.8